MMHYPDFLAQRRAVAPSVGFDVAERDLHPSLFPFQKAAIQLACRRGRAALFQDTGLGKSRQILEWMRLVCEHTGGRALLLVPLAVAHQFVNTEAPALGLELAYCRSQADADASNCRLIVTNYEMASRFDPDAFAGVALDEADIISNFVGKTNRLLTKMFRNTPYKLVATATPAPNDLIELGRYSEFLGVMESGEMLTRYFIRDSQSAATLRLRHWADAGPFWDWLTTWALCMGLPSDLGPYSDDGYILPPLTIEQHTVDVDYGRALAQGKLFPDAKQSATDLWATKHDTLAGRIAKVVQIVNESHDWEHRNICLGNQNTPSADALNINPIPMSALGDLPKSDRQKTTANICSPTTKKTSRSGKQTEKRGNPRSTDKNASDTQMTLNTEKKSKQRRATETRPLSEIPDFVETSVSVSPTTMQCSLPKMDDAQSVELNLATAPVDDFTLITTTQQERLEDCSAQIAIWESGNSTMIPMSSGEPLTTLPNLKLEPWLIWCSTDDEQKALATAFGDRAISVYGSLSPEEKERRILAWLNGERPVFITKPSICGSGLNFQHCAHMIFCSPTFSFRHFYQGLRRIYRFRQLREVTCHVVIAETEENVIAAVDRKQSQHRQLHAQARAAMRRQSELSADWRVAEGATRPLVVPGWLKKAA